MTGTQIPIGDRRSLQSTNGNGTDREGAAVSWQHDGPSLLATRAAAGQPVTVATCARGEQGEVIGADLAHLAGEHGS